MAETKGSLFYRGRYKPQTDIGDCAIYSETTAFTSGTGGCIIKASREIPSVQPEFGLLSSILPLLFMSFSGPPGHPRNYIWLLATYHFGQFRPVDSSRLACFRTPSLHAPSLHVMSFWPFGTWRCGSPFEKVDPRPSGDSPGLESGASAGC